MATIKDVAARAGVSVGSVSRVFRRHPTVGPGLEAQVRKAAADLGYLHLAERRAMSAGQTLRRLGHLTVGMAHPPSRLPVVATLLEGVVQSASARGIDVVVCDAPDLQDVPALVRARQVDGLLVKAG